MKFLREPTILRPSNAGEWSDADLKSLADEYAVSREAVLRRLLTLHMTTQAFYRRKRAEYMVQYEEAAKRRAKKSTGGPSTYLLRVRNLGRSYVRNAFEAYHREQITTSELSDFLRTRVDHLPKLEASAHETSSVA